MSEEKKINDIDSLREKRIKEYEKRFSEASLIEDLKFREVAKSKEAIEEVLCTILQDDNISVIKTIEQKNISDTIYHGVILDCECVLSTKEIVNVEVQVALNDNPIYRMRYNQSALTISHSPKSKDFKYDNLPKLISIMICDFDYYNLNEPIYEIKRVVKGTNITSDNGIRELYVNLHAKPNNKKLEILFKILTDLNFVDNNIFPALSKKKMINKNGGDNMLNGLTKEFYEVAKQDGIKQGIKQGIEKGIEQGSEKGKITVLIDLLNNRIISEEVVMDKLNISKEELTKLIKSQGKN